MSLLKSVSIKGVWGERDFDFSFHPDVNFLIGPNGSGKTTVINLLAAALTADYEELTRIPFVSIACEMAPEGQAKQGRRIIIERTHNESISPIINYSLTLPEGRRQFELFPSSASYALRARLTRSLRGMTDRETLLNSLHEMVRVKWLSVYRSPSKSDPEDRPRGESSVDRRVHILNNSLVRHFSKLAGLKEAETNHFISTVFLALLYRGGKKDPFSVAKDVNPKKLKEAMQAIFHHFQIDDDRSIRELNGFFEIAQRASQKSTYDSTELATWFGILPISKVVEEWNKTLAKQEEILRPQHDFLQIINSMLRGKNLEINSRNELEVVLDNPTHKRLALSDLSSGEKQLLIIFGEALLQDRGEFLYIADEPELSLHVGWQEHLTGNLRKINPNAQVIFATHSPDIVSTYGDRVISVGDEEA